MLWCRPNTFLRKSPACIHYSMFYFTCYTISHMNHVIAHMRVDDSLLVDAFGKNKDVIKTIQNVIDERTAYVQYLDLLKSEGEKIIFETLGAPVTVKEFCKDVINGYLDYESKDHIKHISKMTMLKSRMKGNVVRVSGNVTPQQVDSARQYPMTDLLDVNRAGFACCIFHTEDTPSMKYYPEQNTAYCFGCHKKADCIDVYIQLHNVSFIEAVKKLNNI
jgi:hypothetical protein